MKQALILATALCLLAGCASTVPKENSGEIIFAKPDPDNPIAVHGVRIPVYTEGREMPIKMIKAGFVFPLYDGKKGYAEDLEIEEWDEQGRVTSSKKYDYAIIDGRKIIPAPPTKVETEKGNRIYRMKAGDTLWKLGKDLYGNRHYSKVIALHNNVTDPTKIQINQVIQTPQLRILLEKEGLSKTSSHEIKLILNARKIFMKHETQMFILRQEEKDITKEMKQDLLRAADSIDKAVAGLSKKKPGIKKIPRRMIGQLKNISINLKQLDQGANDGYRYDLDMVHQRMVYAMLNGIKWARSDFE